MGGLINILDYWSLYLLISTLIDPDCVNMLNMAKFAVITSVSPQTSCEPSGLAMMCRLTNMLVYWSCN